MSQQATLPDKQSPVPISRYNDLMQRCGERVANNLSRLLVSVFEQIDSAFSIYRPDGSDQEACEEFDQAISELKNRRLWIGKSFYNGLSNSLKRFIQGIETTPELFDEKLEGASESGAPVQEKQHLELEMAMANLLSNIHYEFSETLPELSRRLAVVNGGKRLDECSLSFPAGPEVACRLFMQLIESIDIPFEIRLILIDLFDIKVMQRAEPAYDQFNQALQEAGILPNLKQPSGTDGSVIASHPTLTETDRSHQPEQDLFSQIRKLLDQHQNADKPDLSEHNAAAFIVYLNESTPARLSSADLLLEGGELILKRARQQLAGLIEQDKSRLAEQDPQHGLGWVVQLIGLLFEYILDDRQLPNSVKAVLSELYRPLLRVAFSEQQLFLANQHPALRLMDSLSLAGLRYSPGDHNTLGILAKIQSTVTRVVKSADLGVRGYSQLLKDFNDYVREGDKQSKLCELSAIKALQGRQGFVQASDIVANELHQRIATFDIPAAIETFLLGPWKNYLVMTCLKSSDNAQLWQRAWQTTDDLLQNLVSADRSSNAETRLTQRAELVRYLKEGLAMIGEHEINVDTLLASAEGQAASARAIDAQAAALLHGAEPRGTAGEPNDCGERIQQLREILPPEWLALRKHADSSRDDEVSVETQALMSHLKALPFGTWFQFEDSQTGQASRGKLAWVNGVTLTFMFVNQDGRQIAVKSLYQLADEIQAGQTKIVVMEKKSLLNRTLNAIHKVLSRN